MRLLSARLSAKRRSPLAGLVVLLMGLLVTGGLYAVLSPASAQTSAADQSTVTQGRNLFLVGCASCHGKNAEGIQTKRGNQYGPSLVGVGAAAAGVRTAMLPTTFPRACLVVVFEYLIVLAICGRMSMPWRRLSSAMLYILLPS